MLIRYAAEYFSNRAVNALVFLFGTVMRALDESYSDA